MEGEAHGWKADVYVFVQIRLFGLCAYTQPFVLPSIAVRFLADDAGAFTAKLGLLFDATPLLGGPRSKVISFSLVRCARILNLILNLLPCTALRTHCGRGQSDPHRDRGGPFQRRCDLCGEDSRIPLIWLIHVGEIINSRLDNYFKSEIADV